jgi:hypothetical protein
MKLRFISVMNKLSFFAPILSIYSNVSNRRCFKFMDQDKREKMREKRVQEKFNSESNSVKPSNQNQEHNVRKEGVGRQDFKYRGQ